MPELKSLLANNTIIGFGLGDELVWGGVTPSVSAIDAARIPSETDCRRHCVAELRRICEHCARRLPAGNRSDLVQRSRVLQRPAPWMAQRSEEVGLRLQNPRSGRLVQHRSVPHGRPSPWVGASHGEAVVSAKHLPESHRLAEGDARARGVWQPRQSLPKRDVCVRQRLL